MFYKIFSKTILSLALFTFVFTSCTKEEYTISEEGIAFSSNGVADVPVGSDKTFYKFTLNNGKSNWSSGGTYQLGIVADERVREVYILAPGKHTSWKRVKSTFAQNNSFNVDKFLKNALFNSKKSGLNAYALGSSVVVTYGNKYAVLRIDSGTVFRDNGSSKGTFPNNISSFDYLPFRSIPGYPNGAFLGVTKDGFVAASTKIGGPYVVPTIPANASGGNVNVNSQTAGKVKSLIVTSNKAVKFNLENGGSKTGFANRSLREFIKI